MRLISIIRMALLGLLLLSAAQAQINWSEYSIDSNFDGAFGLDVRDMDGDGDVDVISCAKNADDVAWYENDGQQFFTKHIIEGDFNGGKSVRAIDMDGDGDIDVLGAAEGAGYAGLIYWWENDGDMNFSPYVVSSSFQNTHCADAADLDGDGDIDIFAVATWGHQVAWWENDGSENFTQHIILNNFRYPYYICAVDFDFDGDMDLLAGAAYEELTWLENDGQENFSMHAVTYMDSCFSTSIAVADMDDDGDLDVLASELWTDRIYWFENAGNYAFYMHIIEYNYQGAYSIAAADIDNDGDMDAVGAAWDDDAVSWWENNDLSFTRQDLTTSFSYARVAIPVDVDGDGSLDIVATGERADRVNWWESDLVTSIPDNAAGAVPNRVSLLPAHPNPFNSSTTITFALNKPQHVTLDIYDLQGRKLQTLVEGFQEPGYKSVILDASGLASGVYFYRLQAHGYSESKKMILLK